MLVMCNPQGSMSTRVCKRRIHSYSFRASFPSDKAWEPRSWAISWGKRGDGGNGKRFPEMPLNWEVCTRESWNSVFVGNWIPKHVHT
jgi:hypothetical protein